MKIFLKFKKIKLWLVLILLLACFFRLYGLDWDQGQHLHPDERFLTMVLSAMRIPKSLSDYLNPQLSTMNPYNVGYGFFVYGTFPLNLTRVVGEITGNNTYGNIHLVGRILSALFDVGVVYLVYLISKKIVQKKPDASHQSLATPLLAAFLYSIMVLPIQLSHFFAVDTFLNFFIVLSFYFLILLITNHPVRHASQGETDRQSLITAAALGGSFALALACKISAVLFLPILLLGIFIKFLSVFPRAKGKLFVLFQFAAYCLLFAATCYLLFRFNQPQAFTSENFFDLHPNLQLLKNFQQLRSQADPNSTFPPAVQWISTKPIIFPLKNMILWGIGLPLGIISIISVFFAVIKTINVLFLKKDKLINRLISQSPDIIIFFWIFFLFIFQSIQFAKTIRYFLFIYPFLALLSAQFLSEVFSFLKTKFPRHYDFLLLSSYSLLLIYPVSFMNIYTKPITRVTASEWIYQSISPNSTLLEEEWDDGLPLPLPQRSSQIYKYKSVFMYDVDTPEKWRRIQPIIDSVDYIIITSNRAYGSTMSLPKRYPQTTRYYQSLFTSSDRFKKVAEFTSYPCFPPGKYNLFCFDDDSSEESFTVYDHPKVIIFKKNMQ